MVNLEEIENKLKELKSILKEKFKVENIGLFGSYVRGKRRRRVILIF